MLRGRAKRALYPNNGSKAGSARLLNQWREPVGPALRVTCVALALALSGTPNGIEGSAAAEGEDFCFSSQPFGRSPDPDVISVQTQHCVGGTTALQRHRWPPRPPRCLAAIWRRHLSRSERAPARPPPRDGALSGALVETSANASAGSACAALCRGGARFG